jgi:hypothetical protein
MRVNSEQRLLQVVVLLATTCVFGWSFTSGPDSQNSPPLAPQDSKFLVREQRLKRATPKLGVVEFTQPMTPSSRAQSSSEEGGRLILRLQELGASLDTQAELAVFDDWHLLERASLRPGSEWALDVPTGRNLLVAVNLEALSPWISPPDLPARRAISRGEFSVVEQVRLRADEDRVVELRLARLSALELLLLDTDGEPLSEEPVVVQRVDLPEPAVRSVASSSGQVVLEAIPRGEYRVFAPRRAMGGAVLPISVFRLDPGERLRTTLQLEPASGEVSGSIYSRDGVPASRVRVDLQSLGARIGSVHTNSQGQFSFSGVPSGELIVVVPRQESEALDGCSTMLTPVSPYRLEISVSCGASLDLGQLQVYPVRRPAIVLHLVDREGGGAAGSKLLAVVSDLIDPDATLAETLRGARRALEVQSGEDIVFKRPMPGSTRQLSFWLDDKQLSSLTLSSSSPDHQVLPLHLD